MAICKINCFSKSNPAILNVDELQKARVPASFDDGIVQGHPNYHVIESYLGTAVGAKLVRVLIFEKASAGWAQIHSSQISDETAL